MTNDGLSTARRSVDYDNKKKEDKRRKDNDDQDEDPGYRYKRPAAPTQPKAGEDTVKKTAALQVITDSHLYLLSALFQ
jgi:hypothetical protein